MEKYTFDQNDFTSLDSEQSAEMAVSSFHQHYDLAEFLAECGSTVRDRSPPPIGWTGWNEVVDTVKRLIQLELPRINTCRVTLLNNTWDDLEIVVATQTHLLWYHWWTTA